MTLPRTMRTIGFGAFADSKVVSLVVPDTVTSVGSFAFDGASDLRRILFQGNAPVPAANAFYDCDPTIYYLPGTAGWSSAFGAKLAFMWNPQIPTGFGIRSNGFGFNVTGNTNLPIVIEAAPSLGAPVWLPLQSGVLTNGVLDFTDQASGGYLSRLYRVGFP